MEFGKLLAVLFWGFLSLSSGEGSGGRTGLRFFYVECFGADSVMVVAWECRFSDVFLKEKRASGVVFFFSRLFFSKG